MKVKKKIYAPLPWWRFSKKVHHGFLLLSVFPGALVVNSAEFHHHFLLLSAFPGALVVKFTTVILANLHKPFKRW